MNNCFCPSIILGGNDKINYPHLEREPTQLSEDFGRYTKIISEVNFTREQQAEDFYDEDDMNDPNLDKAATRIQASYRGYKTRKELGTPGGQSNPGQDQSHSSRTHDEYNNNTHNKNSMFFLILYII
jgi:hypothetical protein